MEEYRLKAESLENEKASLHELLNHNDHNGTVYCITITH